MKFLAEKNIKIDDHYMTLYSISVAVLLLHPTVYFRLKKKKKPFK